MNKKILSWGVFLIAAVLGFFTINYLFTEKDIPKTVDPPLPNIVIFYVDDLGYADLSCYGARGVETPNIDSLALTGIKFTDAHSSAATCTPSRYALLTGQYAFRNNARVLPGDAPLIVDPAMSTLPKMLKRAGYATGVVGKWHLGLGRGEIDWNLPIAPGPKEIGFDYDFLLPATGDRVPTVYMENGQVINLSGDDSLTINYQEPLGDRPTGLSHPELLKMAADTQHSNTIINGISRIGYMDGGTSAEWVDEEFPDVFTGKAIEFMDQYKDQPFFLYFSFHDIHVPRAPNPRFVGKSNMGPRGDAIVQMDWMTGEIMSTLQELELLENTLVIFTSDNGPVLNDGYEDGAEEMVGNHNPSGPFRGGKYSAFEAGTRVPTIVYWKGRLIAQENDALWSQVDIYASLAALVEQDLAEDEAIDSQNMLTVMLGDSKEGREWMVEESFTTSLRQNDWKYIRPLTGTVPDWMKNKKIEGGGSNEPQLYNLAEDIGEKTDLANEMKDRVREMEKKLTEIENRTSRAL